MGESPGVVGAMTWIATGRFSLSDDLCFSSKLMVSFSPPRTRSSSFRRIASPPLAEDSTEEDRDRELSRIRM